ncbi:hypothetical protein OB955_16180 [Halobacteria archaeon AArc-m2/3/4]|uniref:Uncharacterized protein n=1 Tax=Natronoglomus mannanivorans TaxID=2979990 RepID=A0AAP2Z386_9EURY|nr:hypothetical protein [Halobacteria archaeon AArc-xg1-1]MCU4974264.1 hypothetical protein [Halobacteria archaeon AArc-m2/3/4]
MVDPLTATILGVSVAGAIGQAIVTVRWYEPPKIDDREPNPLFEAVLFFVAFGAVFMLMGYMLSRVATLAPPYTSFGLLVFVPVGLYLAYATATGRLETSEDRATTLMQAVAAVVVAVYPVALLVVWL